MTLDQFIAVSASVGSCMAALATFLTVSQIAKQRTASYRPELVFAQTFFEADLNDVDSWKSLVEHSFTENQETVKSILKIPLINIGLEAAKNLRLTWSVPFEETINQISKITENQGKKPEVSLDKGILRTNKGLFFWDNERTVMIPYILPASSSSTNISVALPVSYRAILSEIIQQGNKSSVDLPAITAVLDYCDIADRSIRTAFEIKVEIVSIRENLMHAYLEADRLSEPQRFIVL